MRWIVLAQEVVEAEAEAKRVTKEAKRVEKLAKKAWAYVETAKTKLAKFREKHGIAEDAIPPW